MQKFPLPALLLAAALLPAVSPAAEPPPVQALPAMDVQRYAGQWFEVARFPNRFQKQCSGDVTARYTPQADGNVQVLNRCRLADGRYDEATGQARLQDPAGRNTQLEVRFAPAWLSWLPWVWGDYWVIALDRDYRYALVGTPDRGYLWVLSRTPQLDERAYADMLEKAKAQGYDVSRLQRTAQEAGR